MLEASDLLISDHVEQFGPGTYGPISERLVPRWRLLAVDPSRKDRAMPGEAPSLISLLAGSRRYVLAAFLACVGVALVAPATAAAAPPANDSRLSPTPISTLPFSDNVDTTEATEEPNEGGCGPPTHTVWYAITLSEAATLSIHVGASGFSNPSVTLWTGPPPNASAICGGPDGDLLYRVASGHTYYLQIGTRFFWEPGGQVHVVVNEIPPPVNDDFAAARAFSDLPFSDSGNLSGATVEPGEPQASPYYPPIASVWYRLEPTVSRTVTVGGAGIAVAAFSGSQLGQLVPIGFQELAYGVPLALRSEPGTPVYLQVVPQFGGGGGPFSLTVAEAPSPIAEFSFAPQDPSIFDRMQFFDQSFDPVQLGIRTWSWSFDDGSTASGCCPTHRYGADGDYAVRLEVTTNDGRTASSSHVVHVQTHDVAIKALSTPTNGKAGKTVPISVGISNARYPETVQVQLLKSVPGSSNLEQVGVLTLLVPARKSKQTSFDFSYTFTSDDAAVGKVTFEAVATILGSRDALPADNTRISAPTHVSP
jgi:hypothetical protein